MGVEDSRPVVAFLYLLLRDHLSAGVIEDLVVRVSAVETGPWTFSNGWLANYSQDIAERLDVGEDVNCENCGKLYNPNRTGWKCPHCGWKDHCCG